MPVAAGVGRSPRPRTESAAAGQGVLKVLVFTTWLGRRDRGALLHWPGGDAGADAVVVVPTLKLHLQ